MEQLLATPRQELSAERCRVEIEIGGLSRFEPNKIVYEVAGPDAPREEPNANFALAAVLPTAMSLGRPLHVRGEVDADFLAAMEEYMAAWHRWLPRIFQIVRLSADSEVGSFLPDSRRAIMAFSGGLDSTFALHAHKAGLLGRRALDVEAAVLVEGFDIPLDNPKAAAIARGHVEALADCYGVRLNVVRTNWQKPFAVKWGMTHVLGIAAILHLFHRQFGGAVIADDVSYSHQVTPWSSNAITNQMLGSSAFPIRATGAAWGRTEKAVAVASNPVVLEHLRVCYERPELGGNCGECEKCLRTKLNFYAAGVGFMPALGAPITLEEVTKTIPLNANFLYRYEDMLKHGRWRAGDTIRDEVAELVSRLRSTLPGSGNGERRHQQTPLQRAKKRARPLIRAVKGTFATLNPYRPRSSL